MGKTYYIRKVGVGGGSSGTLTKKNKCWSLFHIPPPPCSCYTITCLRSGGNANDSIYLWDGYQVRIFLKLLFGLTRLPREQESNKNANFCSTSSSHIDLAGAFHGYPIRLVKLSNVNHILPLKLNGSESWEVNELLWGDNHQGIGCVSLLLILPPAWQLFQ